MRNLERYKAKPLSRFQIRDVALRLRMKLGIQGQKYVNVINILENEIKKIYNGFSFSCVDDSELPDVLGMTFPDENRIVLCKSVYEGALEGNGRDRFTIMHEIGHLILHRNSRVIPIDDDDIMMLYEDLEWQADAFAGEFLMEYDVVRNMQTEEVAEKCGVSLSAANVQMKHYQRVGMHC